MDSESSSRASSTALMTGSMAASCSLVRLRGLIASASRSKTLMEYQRERSESQLPEIMEAIFWSASSTSAEKHLTPAEGFFAAMAARTSSSTPVLCRAETSSTVTPRRSESLATSTLSPRSLSRSHMFRPMTTGRPASRTWVVR